MNNKSIKALALLAIFSVSIAGATTMLTQETAKEAQSQELAEFKAPTDKKIRKKDIARRLQAAKRNGML